LDLLPALSEYAEPQNGFLLAWLSYFKAIFSSFHVTIIINNQEELWV
jgi:hypothetical protein